MLYGRFFVALHSVLLLLLLLDTHAQGEGDGNSAQGLFILFVLVHENCHHPRNQLA